ncbi:MAG: hypothetical protein ABEK59_02785 [Halobacteria archaeon]
MSLKTAGTLFLIVLVIVPLWVLTLMADFDKMDVDIEGYIKADAANDVDFSLFA